MEKTKEEIEKERFEILIRKIEDNSRESKMVQNFLIKILESSQNQEKLLKDLNKINNEIKRVIQLR